MHLSVKSTKQRRRNHNKKQNNLYGRAGIAPAVFYKKQSPQLLKLRTFLFGAGNVTRTCDL